MDAVLDGGEDADMLVRREAGSDVPAIDRVHAAAFAGPTSDEGVPVEVGLVHELRADPGWVPALSLVALDDTGAVIGHVVASEGTVDGRAVVGVGPLGVLPDRQHSGVGAALMHAVLAAADALGYPLAGLLGEPAYYRRFGFVAATTVGIEPPDPAWGEFFQVRLLTTDDPPTGVFCYAAPFDSL